MTFLVHASIRFINAFKAVGAHVAEMSYFVTRHVCDGVSEGKDK